VYVFKVELQKEMFFMAKRVLAFDFGASSGRAMLGEVELNEENIAYDELITITAENVDQFLE